MRGLGAFFLLLVLQATANPVNKREGESVKTLLFTASWPASRLVRVQVHQTVRVLGVWSFCYRDEVRLRTGFWLWSAENALCGATELNFNLCTQRSTPNKYKKQFSGLVRLQWPRRPTSFAQQASILSTVFQASANKTKLVEFITDRNTQRWSYKTQLKFIFACINCTCILWARTITFLISSLKKKKKKRKTREKRKTRTVLKEKKEERKRKQWENQLSFFFWKEDTFLKKKMFSPLRSSCLESFMAKPSGVGEDL